jgi:hypothetical protein
MNAQITDDREYWHQKKSHRLEGTSRVISGRLGICPKGWHVLKIDLAICHHRCGDGRPLAFVANRGWLKIVRLEKEGYRRCVDGTFPIAYCADVQNKHPLDCPWKSEIKWLEYLTADFKITALIWAERGGRDVYDPEREYPRPLPHRYDWEPYVRKSVWYFREYHRSPAELLALMEPLP